MQASNNGHISNVNKCENANMHRHLAKFHTNDIDCEFYLQFEHISIGSDDSFPCNAQIKLFKMCQEYRQKALQFSSARNGKNENPTKMCVFFAQHFFLGFG